ncbi:MAG: phospholipase D family protein [Rhizobacter sp.]|nr:phospholipase D family protein [Bacteriovorax sp.]
MKKTSISLLLLVCLISPIAKSADTDIPPYRVTSTTGNDMRVVTSGSASLYERLDMIRNAKESINLETFIFNPDTAGRLVLKELAAAAKRGVKVKVLVDKSAAVFKMDEYYAKAMKDAGIEIRYYNPASVLQISSVQFRNHRKLLSVDGKKAITGGRNVADEYYDLSKEFNFLDRDATVKGDLVGSMDKTFDDFWDSKIVEKPKMPSPPDESLKYKYDSGSTDEYDRKLSEFNKRTDAAKKVFGPNVEDDKVLAFLNDKGKAELEKHAEHNCPEAAFASDKEGASFKERLDSENYHNNYRLLRKEIGKWIDTKIKDEVIIDSPYFLNNKLSEDIAADLLKKKKKITIFTNSLASTDAIYVSTVFNDTVKKYTPDENFSANIYKGKYSGESELYSDAQRNAIWGTHSKTIAFSDDAIMIGTFNVDNRSSFYNTEMAIFCSGSKELAADVKDNIKKRMEGSNHLNTSGEPDNCSDLLGEVSTSKRVIYNLIKPISHLLQFLL